jgi:hypothetical protein
MTLDRSYIGYLGILVIDLFKSVLMYSNCLIKLLFKMGPFTVYSVVSSKKLVFYPPVLGFDLDPGCLLNPIQIQKLSKKDIKKYRIFGQSVCPPSPRPVLQNANIFPCLEENFAFPWI